MGTRGEVRGARVRSNGVPATNGVKYKRVNLKLPAGMHKYLRAQAALDGQTIQAALEELVKEYVKVLREPKRK